MQTKANSSNEKSDRENTTNERSSNEKVFGRPNQLHSNAQARTHNSPLNVADRPPSTSSTASSFRNPFTDDDDSEYVTSASGSNSIKNSSADAAVAFGQPAWSSIYNRSYEHGPKGSAVVYPAHAFHDQQSHLYHPPTNSGSGSYMMPPQVCAAAHGCECQSCNPTRGTYSCCPPPHPHPIYCQLHPSDLPGHPNCVYCRSAATPYLPHHSHPPPPPPPHHHHHPPLGPTEFGPSFDFGSDFDPKSPPPTADSTYGQLHQAYTGTNSSQHDPSESDSTRSLSPSNPFNPIVSSANQPVESIESSSGLVPPPRPPARTDPGRGSNASLGEADIPPPLLPKRKTASSVHLPSTSNIYQQQPPPPPPQVPHQYFHHHGYPLPHPHHMMRHTPPHYPYHGNDVYGYITAPPVHLTHPHAHHGPHSYPSPSGMMNPPPSSSPGAVPQVPMPVRKKSITKYNTVERRVSFENPSQGEAPHTNYPLTRQQSQPVSAFASNDNADPFDPFNVNFVEEGLNQVMKPTSIASTTKSEESKETPDDLLKTSTPLNSESNKALPPHATGEVGQSVSTIQPSFDDSFATNTENRSDGQSVPSIHNVKEQQLNTSSLEVSNVSDSVFNDSNSNSNSVGSFDTTGYTRLNEQELFSKANDGKVELKKENETSKNSTNDSKSESSQDIRGPFKHFGKDHVSPPERNIFQHKDDPFADDDFFATQ